MRPECYGLVAIMDIPGGYPQCFQNLAPRTYAVYRVGRPAAELGKGSKKQAVEFSIVRIRA